MNAFNYFFENTSNHDKLFLAGKEEISFRQLYAGCLNLGMWLENELGRGKHIMLISVNNLFFIKAYLTITVKMWLQIQGAQHLLRVVPRSSSLQVLPGRLKE